jgi:hypothetical protein
MNGDCAVRLTIMHTTLKCFVVVVICLSLIVGTVILDYFRCYDQRLVSELRSARSPRQAADVVQKILARGAESGQAAVAECVRGSHVRVFDKRLGVFLALDGINPEVHEAYRSVRTTIRFGPEKPVCTEIRLLGDQPLKGGGEGVTYGLKVKGKSAYWSIVYMVTDGKYMGVYLEEISVAASLRWRNRGSWPKEWPPPDEKECQ